MTESQLFVTDMDGTLLDADSRVTPRSARIISDLTRRGALITVATARTPATVEGLLRDVATAPPAIVLTGASFWDRQGKRFVDPRLMTDEVAASVTRVCMAHGLTPMTYTLPAPLTHIEMFVYGTPSSKEARFIDERRRLPFKHVNLMGSAKMPQFHRRTILIFALGELSCIEAVAAELRAGNDCSVSAYPDIFNHSAGYLEVFANGVSKASAVEHLRELCHAGQVTVFGDNLNDIPMMAVADRAVAVANAMPSVKAAAHEVIGPNTDDSVARYIQAHFES